MQLNSADVSACELREVEPGTRIVLSDGEEIVTDARAVRVADVLYVTPLVHRAWQLLSAPAKEADNG